MVVSAFKLCDANKRVLSGSDILDDEIPWALCVRGFTGRYEGGIFRRFEKFTLRFIFFIYFDIRLLLHGSLGYSEKNHRLF